MKQQLLIIGFGMATHRLLQSLIAAGHDWDITVIGKEAEPAYNRILLSPLLARELTAEELMLSPMDWYRDHGIHLHLGDGARTLDRDRQRVITEAGQVFPYDRAVLATGSRAAMPGIRGEAHDGVLGLRTVADCRWLMERAQQGRPAVVIGGGFLGLEAAEGLRKQGMAVSLVHRGGFVLNRQLDEVAGGMLGSTLSRRGLELHLDSGIRELVGDDSVRAVRLDDGRVLAADLVVLATGITPNRELAQEAGLECHRGIMVDDRLRTSDPNIHALGECCQLGEQTYGLVEPVNHQADALARTLGGQPTPYQDQPLATRLKISGIEVFSCGELDQTPGDVESIVYHDRHGGEYRRLLLRDNRLVGAILYGDTSAGPWLFEHLKQNTDLSPWRDRLAFGEAYCDAA